MLDETLLSDPQKLKEAFIAQQEFISSLHQKHIEALQTRDQEIENLKEMILLLKRARFASQSEKLRNDIRQMGIFNEAEAFVEKSSEEPQSQEIKSHKRGKPKRKPLPDYIEREEEIIEIPEKERFCSEGHPLEEIGEETSERLDVIPMQLKVKRTIRKKYACKSCQGEVKTAPLPASILPKANAAEGLLAHIAISKYADGLPLYRQESMFRRLEIELDRTTMARWMIGVGQAVEPLLNLMREDIQSSSYVQCDESRLQVLKESGRKATSTSYMWVMSRASPEEKPIVVYEYDPTRKGEVPLRLLDGFQGYLQVDGYSGYNEICAKKNIIRLGCMAHMRRKFHEASKVSQKKGLAKTFLEFIQKLYELELFYQERSPQDRFEARQNKAKPVLEEMKEWLDEYRAKVPPQSTLGKAISYALNEWPYLVRYLEAGHLRIDNNFIENKIRPFAVGRKNWLFSATPKGAQASASLYSLIETAKANNLNPFRYLHRVLLELPKATTLEQIEALLPYNVKL